MKQADLNKFVAKLLANYSVFAPVKKDGGVFVGKVDSEKQVDWSGEMPVNSFKSVFLPPREVLLETNKQGFNAVDPTGAPTVALAMNVLDLQAFTLVEHVFEKDFYYQERRQSVYIVGFTNGIEDDFRRYKVFHQKYEENVLEHVMFDVFIEKQKNGKALFFSGSQKGQRLLESAGISDYENIEFAGLQPETGIDPRVALNRAAVEKGEENKLWKELSEICMACGKCSIACPTCFCFDEVDEPDLDSVRKVRQWASCFYPEFSKVVGGHKDLNTLAKKLYFWYFHKFVRIPDELGYFGCVSCMRCYKACPVGINIAKNLQKLKEKHAQ